ncbi:S-layer homology domain-containing protein [Kurthia gibsonii]|uniref:S-layer homology domain-containing protein n=1 Tax=Kurthia gibsonii TaxID=33946 RepID=UPI0011420B91|nr:S-layer homology domain-containing protein [Kurthia gibsonii]GED19586.1 hypothetical protein KGI01_13270 [Kurthia gibsonii]
MIKKLITSTLALTLALSVATSTADAATSKSTIFKDVPKTHSMYKHITSMKQKGIISGYSDGTFRPNQGVTRKQVIAMAAKATQLKPVRKGKEFKDVKKSDPNYKRVQLAYRAGIIDGKSNGKFGLNDKVTRAEMSKILVKTFKLKLQKGYIFNDITKSNSYKDYAATLYAKGIIPENKGKFEANKVVTRAEYAAFTNRTINPSQALKPSKKLKSTPVKAKVANTSYVSPFKKKPSKTPPGAKLLKTEKFETGVWKTYSYNKKISGGHKIKLVRVNKYVVVIKVQVKKYEYLAQYNRENSRFSFLMLDPKVSQNTIEDLYTIGEDFDAYLSGWY